MKNYLKSGLVAVALTASIGASAALIKSPEEAIKVDAEGLDLRSEKGQEMLYSRLQKASRDMCGATSIQEAGSLARALDNRACYKETLTKAVESVGNASLSQLHRSS